MDHLLSLIARAASALPDDVRPRTVVFGSAPMALAGLPRVPGDLDLFMSREGYLRLREAGGEEELGAPVPRLRLDSEIEVISAFPGVDFDEALAAASRPPAAQGMAVASLEHVVAYKRALSRPKDLADLEMLERWCR